jgi:hypothetical protein
MWMLKKTHLSYGEVFVGSLCWVWPWCLCMPCTYGLIMALVALALEEREWKPKLRPTYCNDGGMLPTRARGSSSQILR